MENAHTTRVVRLERAALVVAILGALGSVALSTAMELKACPLCFYQRTFMFAALAVLGIAGLGSSAFRPGMASMLAVPIALGGLAVALFHVSLELRGILECPGGILGLGTALKQSLFAFVLLAAAVLPSAVLARGSMPRSGSMLVGGCLLGVTLGDV